MSVEHEPERDQWLCVQAGHREMYGIPRALQRVGALQQLLTDLWVPPESLFKWLSRGSWGRRLADRYSADIPQSKVHAFSLQVLAWEMAKRARGMAGATAVIQYANWWGNLVARNLKRHTTSTTSTVFCYCYEARQVFAAARKLGLRRVLGQIDPGPEEDRKVEALVRKWSNYRTTFRPGSESYYASWREECAEATCIAVNSEWSRRSLVAAGVAEHKIEVVPLVFTPPVEASGWQRNYPDRFTQERPLRILFLGQCILRKGIAETIEAAQRLLGLPVEFTLVGNTDIEDLPAHFGNARINYYPRVSRGECHAFFRAADLFLFPTHSDGFGLTQLEAQAWKLPIIASQFCAEVVEVDRTGWVLPEVSSLAIEEVLKQILDNPRTLMRLSSSIEPWPFKLDQLGHRLVDIQAKGVIPT